MTYLSTFDFEQSVPMCNDSSLQMVVIVVIDTRCYCGFVCFFIASVLNRVIRQYWFQNLEVVRPGLHSSRPCVFSWHSSLCPSDLHVQNLFLPFSTSSALWSLRHLVVFCYLHSDVIDDINSSSSWYQNSIRIIWSTNSAKKTMKMEHIWANIAVVNASRKICKIQYKFLFNWSESSVDSKSFSLCVFIHDLAQTLA